MATKKTAPKYVTTAQFHRVIKELERWLRRLGGLMEVRVSWKEVTELQKKVKLLETAVQRLQRRTSAEAEEVR